MTTSIRRLWQFLFGQDEEQLPAVESDAVSSAVQELVPDLDIAPNDPILPYFQSAQGVVEIDRLNLDSPALQALKESGIKLTVPLVSQGELIGLLNLGPRLSEQEYSADDRRLLSNLATQAAPALRVAQLVREQQAEARERERIDQELRVARIIQQTLLPKELPRLPGWHVEAFYQPARDVGGDFYDFINFPDGRLGLIVGDVTDKGVPAALVMASTRSILRSAAERLVSPGVVLERANELLHDDIPPNMFATCLYAILEPDTGTLCFANAGHNLPYRHTPQGIEELRATGMPLGLMPGMRYEEHQTTLRPGESVLFSSDGLVEAHNPERHMFGFPQVKELMAAHPGGAVLIQHLLDALAAFTGPEYEQEDDITLVTLEYLADNTHAAPAAVPEAVSPEGEPGVRSLAEFNLRSEPGNERMAMEQLELAVEDLHLPPDRLERLKTAVAEATMNAMEHGHKYQADLPVHIDVLASGEAVTVRITDQGGGREIIEPDEPDLEAKLAGEQSPRGWGLFLIKHMVDEMNITSDRATHTVELVLHRKDQA